MTAPRVLMHVQSLKGTGHQRRSAAIARALAERGAAVVIASGDEEIGEGEGIGKIGAGADGVRLARLPTVRAAGPGYGLLVDANGAPIDDAWRRRRRRATLDALAATDPAVVVLETFPFGRRKLRFELLALLDAAATMPRPPAVAVSLRDVPEPRRDRAERAAMVALAAQRCDRVLVHGDPRIVRLEETFPEADALAGRLAYTGYVLDAAPGRTASADGHGEVIVSAGGGAAGEGLLRAAVDAALAATADPGPRWRVLLGARAPQALVAHAAAVAGASSRLVVERDRDDLPGLLRNCAVSISQAGYNTVLEVVAARARAIVVPHAEGGEREQTIRARRFAARGLLEVLDGARLDHEALAAALADAVRRALAAGRPRSAPAVDLGGAARSAVLICELAARG